MIRGRAVRMMACGPRLWTGRNEEVEREAGGGEGAMCGRFDACGGVPLLAGAEMKRVAAISDNSSEYALLYRGSAA